MNKTPKKAAPGGDERNLYNRRLKATTAAASKASETSSHKRQRESESSNRPVLSAVQKRIPERKNFRSKVRVPTKFESNRPTKQVGRPPGSKEKKLASAAKSVETKPAAMQPESGEAEAKLNVPIQEESTKESSSSDDKEKPAGEQVEHISSEPAPVSKGKEDSTNKESAADAEQDKTGSSEQEKAANESAESKEVEEREENDIMLSFEAEDSPGKTRENKENDKDSKDESKEEFHSVLVESRSSEKEKEELQSESQTDTESYSENVLESTTSELSEASEVASQIEAQKEKEEPVEAAKDVSFVSYDPSIMLKDVQIKLNDCLKENSKLFDASNAERCNTPQPPKDASFGRTLRSISGRRSLSRMRHVTLREQRYSPNNSMFVNTSGASLPPDDTADFKILRYSTGLSDTVSTTNGSPSEKKRKHDTDDWNSAKKQKTETENATNLLHTSISLLKGLRRPIQVSNSVSELKFQSGKLELGEDESPSVNEGARKWCAIM